ncbi:hypothetical protein ASG31_09795 [Chryseobacterium sp. Leaf404]|uniref:DUF4274 domain-containing protein n=1 Tax=unclassified Chryseobacterium TaxID=2593645 RepID=UPI0006FBFD23|nr:MULTISPECIES: DUF4274 domain-containing protein [unclassified Chryseobacterium]KQT17673.1 hypothetical protein ASG31_09795 [Chryseobacterium sp. Leaf404]
MKYKVSEKRAEFLREKFFEYSFRGIDLDLDTLNNITEPIELDFIARNHNYDDGNDILLKIIENPNCDLSTIKMIFFRADLDGFLARNIESEDFELISNIVANCKKDYYQSERFYYTPEEDSYKLDFDLDKANSIFPKILFGKSKGRKIEPNFAEFFKQRNIPKSNINIEKLADKITIRSAETLFEYDFPNNFKIICEQKINQFIDNYKFPQNLKSTFSISDKLLKKVVINPQVVLKNDNTTIILFLFNAKPLRMENALTNVATIMRNEFSYIQAFFQITGVEENFDKIRRIKSNENWFAISRGMQVKIENFQEEKYLKILITEKGDFLFYFTIFSNSIENLEYEKIQEQIIDHINVQ